MTRIDRGQRHPDGPASVVERRMGNTSSASRGTASGVATTDGGSFAGTVRARSAATTTSTASTSAVEMGQPMHKKPRITPAWGTGAANMLPTKELKFSGFFSGESAVSRVPLSMSFSQRPAEPKLPLDTPHVAGAGGFEMGLMKAGLIPVEMVDFECFHPFYREKFGETVKLHKNIEEMTEISPGVDLVCGGWPCQQNSRNGKREGQLEGTPSGLIHTLMKLLQGAIEKNHGIPFVVLENVPGTALAGVGLLLDSNPDPPRPHAPTWVGT
jgi:hypothetical protein